MVKELRELSRAKTWGREVSFLLLVFICYLALSPVNVELVRVLVWPVFGFALYAYSSKSVREDPEKLAKLLGRG